MLGIHLQLFKGVETQASLSNIQAMWWDVTEPKDGSTPIGKTDVATTDSSGYLDLDLSKVSGLAIGGYGFLMLYQLDATDHEDSLVFAGKVQTSDIASGVELKYDSGWTRPTDWPEMDEPTTGVQKIQALYPVYDIETAANAVAFVVEAAYTVDWGDGSASEDFASGATATHTFDYANGAYAVITITPQTSNNITKFDANGVPAGFNSSYRYPYLELRINSEYLTTLDVSELTGMEQCWIGEHALTSMSQMFYRCYSLQSVPLFDISAVTNVSYMFYSCYSLQTVPLFDTSLVNTMAYMFSSCYSLQSVPLLNTSLVTSMYRVFYNCYNLQTIPLFNTSLVTNMNRMFYYCYNLQTIPLFNTSVVTDMNQMFYYCYNLQTVPLLDTSSVTGMNQMFYNCSNLQTVPLLDTSALNSDPSTIFDNCFSLREVVLNGFTGYNLDVNECSLGPDALDALYTGLGDGTGMTLTCSANWGYATSTTSIATGKNWTLA